MQLEPGEKSILAYFDTENSARQAAEGLRSQGFNQIRIDPLSSSFRKPRRTSSAYLSALTIGAVESSNLSIGPLLAANPSVSGLSSGEDLMESYSYLVTVVTDDQSLAQARESLLANGALLNG